MGAKRFWLSLNVLLAAVQFAVVAAWIQVTSAGMGLAAESNGIYSYFRDAELFKKSKLSGNKGALRLPTRRSPLLLNRFTPPKLMSFPLPQGSMKDSKT